MTAPPTSRPRSVLIATTNLGGGTGTHLRSLLGRWSPEEWDVHVLCHGPVEVAPPSTVSATERRAFGRLDRFPLAQIRRARHLRSVVRDRAPEVVHAYFFWPVIYARLLRRSGAIPRLVENREDEGFNLGEREFGLLRRTARVPDRVVCVSEAVRRVVVEREGVDPERTRVIRNGVELPEMDGRAQDERASVAREFGFSPSQPVVGTVANLNRAVKGVHHLLEAVREVRHSVPGVRFLIVGDGPDRRSLEARARELRVEESVSFAGFRPDASRFYRAMDLSVLTSLSEGLSITVLESMSHGLPVVATRVGGNPEVVGDGETGLLVPPGDPSAVATAIVRLLRDGGRRREMGREARRRAEERFSLERVAERYQALYREVLDGRP